MVLGEERAQARVEMAGRVNSLVAFQQDVARLGVAERRFVDAGRAQGVVDIGELDDTLFIYIAGDNGTSAEGGFVGMYNEMTYFNGVAEKVEDLIPLIDEWGGPQTFPTPA